MELEELKKLPPRERIKKLKEMEEQRKKEEQQSAKLLRESKAEAEEENRKEIDQSLEELESMTVQQELEGLEEAVQEQRSGLSDEELQQHTEYQQQLAHVPQTEIKQRIYDLNNQVRSSGGWQYASNDQKKEAFDLLEAEKQKYNAIKRNEYSTSENVMESVKSTIDRITGKYDTGGAP